jgi:acylphosphatase
VPAVVSRLRRRYLVQGRVQGVGFRWFTNTCAKREGIGGWVRNLADGRVEIEAMGPAGAMVRFEADVRRGPNGAQVEQFDVEELPPSDFDDGFSIR